MVFVGTSSVTQKESVYRNLGRDSHCDLDICRRAHSILKMANTTGFLRFVWWTSFTFTLQFCYCYIFLILFI